LGGTLSQSQWAVRNAAAARSWCSNLLNPQLAAGAVLEYSGFTIMNASAANLDIQAVHALRLDLALQIARHIRRRGLTQLAAAQKLQIPQPTLSKIANGRVSDLSLELLIRIAVRAQLPLTLQTGRIPEEAGAFAHAHFARAVPANRSALAEQARASRVTVERSLSVAQRLETFLAHSEQVALLFEAGRTARNKGPTARELNRP
jgi:predicted XRE-type DNA-binding protein